MKFTKDQLSLAEGLLDQVETIDVDYREWGYNDVLEARNECAERGMELTPGEMQMVVDLLVYIQEKIGEDS